MLKLKPKCLGKCDGCFFHFINGCVALAGEDYFLPISEKHANLILTNRNRFNISGSMANELMNRFPSAAIRP